MIWAAANGREADTASSPDAIVAAAATPQPATRPELAIAAALDVDAAAASRLSIDVTGRPEDVPLGAYVRVRGLPDGVTLSGGQTNADGSWVVPLWALDDLKIKLPPGVAGSLDLSVALVDNDGGVMAERSAILFIKPVVAAAPSNPAADATAHKETTATVSALAQAGRLVHQGDRYLAQGNIAVARQYFARAADLGHAIAALRMATTYDPNELIRSGVLGVRADPAEAQRWYQRAVELGAVIDERAAAPRAKPAAASAHSTPEAARPVVAAVPSADKADPSQRKRAVPRPAVTGTQRGPGTAPGSRAGMIRTIEMPHGTTAGSARDEPDQDRCHTDNRTPCNIGGGSGWWLWRALGDLKEGRTGDAEQ